jgi:hypothetical protein
MGRRLQNADVHARALRTSRATACYAGYSPQCPLSTRDDLGNGKPSTVARTPQNGSRAPRDPTRCKSSWTRSHFGAPKISNGSCCTSETTTTEIEFMRRWAASLRTAKPAMSIAGLSASASISGTLTAAACISYPRLRDPQFATDRGPVRVRGQERDGRWVPVAETSVPTLALLSFAGEGRFANMYGSGGRI